MSRRIELHGRIFLNKRMTSMVLIMYVLLIGCMFYHSRAYEGMACMRMYQETFERAFVTQTLQIIRLESVLFGVLIFMNKNIDPHLCVASLTVLDRKSKRASVFAVIGVFLTSCLLFLSGCVLLYLIFTYGFTPYGIPFALLGKWGCNMMAVLLFYAFFQGIITLLIGHSTATVIPLVVYWFAELNSHHLINLHDSGLKIFYRYIPHSTVTDTKVFVNAPPEHNMMIIVVLCLLYHMISMKRPLD